MAPRVPRDIEKVEPYRNGDGLPRCKVTLQGGEVVGLKDLTRPELQRAAKLVYPGIPGNVWLRFPTAHLADTIRLGDEVEARRRVQDVQGDKGTKPVVETVEVVDQDGAVTVLVESEPTTPEPAAAVTTSDPAEDLAQAVLALAARVKGGVDEDEVESIVQRVIAAEVDRLDLQEQVKRAVESIGVRRVEVKIGERVASLPEQHHELLPTVVALLANDQHLYLPGPAGSGKSTLAHQAADALGLDFQSISFGPTTPTSKLFGYMDAQGRYVSTGFRQVYEHGGVFLGDELDNGHPGLVAELNQALANGYCAFADKMVKRHPDARIIVTANTFGRGPDRLFVGRNILDAATLDRFFFLEVPVDEGLERGLALAYATDDTRDAIVQVVERVQRVRRRATDLKLPVIVSPRASIESAKLIAGGIDPDVALEGRLWAKVDAQTRAKIDA